jgi:tetratricopeptide (TPR) repeat protein
METKNTLSKAALLYKQGDVNEALKLLEDLVISNPDSSKINATLANTYLDLEIMDKALKHFIKATELDPKWEAASLGLFHFLWGQDKRVEALIEHGGKHRHSLFGKGIGRVAPPAVPGV